MHAYIYIHINMCTYIHKPVYICVHIYTNQRLQSSKYNSHKWNRAKRCLCLGRCKSCICKRRYRETQVAMQSGKHCPSWITSIQGVRDESPPDTWRTCGATGVRQPFTQCPRGQRTSESSMASAWVFSPVGMEAIESLWKKQTTK